MDPNVVSMCVLLESAAIKIKNLENFVVRSHFSSLKLVPALENWFGEIKKVGLLLNQFMVCLSEIVFVFKEVVKMKKGDIGSPLMNRRSLKS